MAVGICAHSLARSEVEDVGFKGPGSQALLTSTFKVFHVVDVRALYS